MGNIKDKGIKLQVEDAKYEKTQIRICTLLCSEDHCKVKWPWDSREGTCIGINNKLYKAFLDMAAAIIASVCIGNRRVRPPPRCLLAGPSGGQDKLFEIRPAVTKKKITALIADGDGFCRMLQQGLLRHHGFETIAVDNGQTAVDLLASGATFSVIILDISLPRLNGLEVTSRIRATGIPTKIIGMTIRFGLSEIEAFMEAGANLVIEKPLLSETLVPILMELAHEP